MNSHLTQKILKYLSNVLKTFEVCTFFNVNVPNVTLCQACGYGHYQGGEYIESSKSRGE